MIAYYRVGDYRRRFTFLLEAQEFRALLGVELPIHAYTVDGKLVY